MQRFYFIMPIQSDGIFGKDILAHAASDPEVPVFSAAVKPRKYLRRTFIHSVFALREIECCVDRLSRQDSGHWLRLGLDASVANDPTATLTPEITQPLQSAGSIRYDQPSS